MEAVLYRQDNSSGLITFPFYTRWELEEIKKTLPECYYQTLEGLFKTIEFKIATPLLEAVNLQDTFLKLLNSFTPLRLALNSYIAHIIMEYPSEIQNILKEGLKEFESELAAASQKQLFLDHESAEILQGILCVLASSWDGILQLPNLHTDGVLLYSLYQHATYLEMCLFSALAPVLGDVKAKRPENIRTLVRWAKSYTLEYVSDLAKLIKAQLANAENVLLRRKFYTKVIAEFSGSGPKGIYEALLEERRQERELGHG